MQAAIRTGNQYQERQGLCQEFKARVVPALPVKYIRAQSGSISQNLPSEPETVVFPLGPTKNL